MLLDRDALTRRVSRPWPRPAPGVDAPWQPPLTRWARAWRLLLMLVISASVVPSAWDAWQRMPVLGVVDVALGLTAFVLVRWRRERPFPVALALAAFGAISVTAAGPGLLAAVSLATRRRYVQIVVVAAVTVLAAGVWPVVAREPWPQPWWLTPVSGLVVVVVLTVLGMYLGSRRELLWTLRERAVRAEAEQALRVEQARATERERIAREMHDVLGHRISLVTMHAGALSFRDDLDRTQVADTAQVILDNAQLAMTDLRSVLGVLRGEHGGDGDRPQPALADVPALVSESREVGMTVALHCDVREADQLPDRLGRTVYRVVQEGLTNVRKHAPASHADVRVTGGPGDGLVVRVSNPLPPSARTRAARGDGYGIVGLSERAELSGGRLETRREGGRFVLEVTLPWEE